MSNAKSRRAAQAAATPMPSARARPDWIALGLAAAGLVLALSLLANRGGAGLPGCAAGGGCDLVQQSRWSTLWGIPVAAWGAATYLALGFMAASPRQDLRRRMLPLAATVAVGVSLYLTLRTWQELRVLCPWCLVSLALITALALRGWGLSERTLRGWLGLCAGLVTLVATAGVHVAQTGMGAAPVHDRAWLAGLATHLTESGAQFYGASWCGVCAGQKAAFGDVADRLPYRECSPHGPGTPQATDCLTAGVQTYPTWRIRGSLRPGALTPEQLARFSGYPPPPARRP